MHTEAFGLDMTPHDAGCMFLLAISLPSGAKWAVFENK